jgi:DNA-binding CsgD family transcriptional regulator
LAPRIDERGNPSSGLFGRDEELRAVLTALAGRGCVVAGSAGVGKSRLAGDAAATLGRSRTVVRVVATAAAATIPFGSVSHLLPGGTAPTIADFVAVLRSGDLGPSPTLFVDDAHLLDDASAALLLAVANTGVAPLLLTVRSHEPAPDALVALWKDRYLDRVDLQALSEREVEQMVDDLLGAPSHALAYKWIYRVSQGNPLFVTEIIADVRRTGRLELREGRWHLDEGRKPFERLSELLASHIGSVSAEAHAALEVLVLGTPMRLSVFEELASADALEELERARLAVVSHDGRGLSVEVAHPLYGEVVLGNLPAFAARRIRRDLAEALAGHGDDTPQERLAVARLLLESGQVDEDRFLEASSIALGLGAPDLAGSLARAVPPSLPAALCLAQALAGAARFGDVEAVLAPFEDDAATGEVEVAAVYVETRVRGLLRAGENIETIRPFIARFEKWHTNADWRAPTASAAAWMAMQDSAWLEAAALVRAPLADADVGAERRLRLLLIAARVSARRGRVDDYDAIIAEVGPLTEELDGRPYDKALNAIRAEAARVCAARDLGGVRQRTVHRLEQARLRGEFFEYVWMLYCLAHIDHVQGHHGEARALFQRVIDHLAIADPLNIAPITDVMQSITLAYLGEAQLARRTLRRAEAAIARTPWVGRSVAPDIDRARAMLEMAAGRVSAAREQLLACASAAGDDVLVASESLHVALLLGADAKHCAAGLEALALDAQDDAIHAWARHARAVAARDPTAQLAAAEALEELGLDLDAAQAGALAAVAFRRDGLSASANRASTLAQRCADRCPGVRVPALAARLDAPDLTAREREIAGLAARGLSNPDIAEALVLSVRSVETYVLRAYRKLGVRNRSDLSKALGVRSD